VRTELELTQRCVETGLVVPVTIINMRFAVFLLFFCPVFKSSLFERNPLLRRFNRDILVAKAGLEAAKDILEMKTGDGNSGVPTSNKFAGK